LSNKNEKFVRLQAQTAAKDAATSNKEPFTAVVTFSYKYISTRDYSCLDGTNNIAYNMQIQTMKPLTKAECQP